MRASAAIAPLLLATLGLVPGPALATDSNSCTTTVVEDPSLPARLSVDSSDPGRVVVCFVVPSGIQSLPAARGAFVVTTGAPVSALPEIGAGYCAVDQLVIGSEVRLTTGFDSVAGTLCLGLNGTRVTITVPTTVSLPQVEVWRDGGDPSVLAFGHCAARYEIERRLGDPNADTNYETCLATSEKVVG
jgi:hypothetical protein